MIERRYGAWRFVHPDLDEGAGASGLRASPTGGIEMVYEDASVRQAILLLLSTRPGERVMRPDYGCDLYRLAFSPNDHTTAGLAIHYVRRALLRWEPRIEILELDADRSPADPGELQVVLHYRVKRTTRQNRIVFPLALNEV